jgi:hypothetical protein
MTTQPDDDQQPVKPGTNFPRTLGVPRANGIGYTSEQPDDELDDILSGHRIASAYIEKYGGSGHSDRQGTDAAEEADHEAKQRLLAWRDKAVREELKIFRKSILAQLQANQTEGK